MLFVAAVLAAFLWLPSPWSWVAIFAAAAVEVGETLFWVRLSRRRRPQIGIEALPGAQALVVIPCRPDGQVRIAGELWQARCEQGADRGETVTVVRVDGLTLVVEPSGRTSLRS